MSILAFRRRNIPTKRITISLSEKTASYVIDMIPIFQMKKSLVVEEMLLRLFGDSEMQEDFKKYSRDYVETTGRREISTSVAVHENFYFSLEILNKLDSHIFDFSFSDRSFFLRVLISFFHDKFYAQDFQKQIDQISLLLINNGYQIERSGIIEDKVFFTIKIQD